MIKIILLTLVPFLSGATTIDSLRTETVNGKTYIIHRVEQKETLFSISKRYGVALLAVVESNPSASSGVEVGTLIKVPYTPGNRTKTAEGIIHRVSQKETLYSIAKQYGVTVDDIKNWNKLSDAGLKLGQELLIKNKVPEISASNASTLPIENNPSQNTHTVAAQETLYAISRKYGVSVQQIKEWNNLTTNDVKPGQKIFISAPTASTSTLMVTKPEPTQSTINLKQNLAPDNTATIKPVTTNPNTIVTSEAVTGSDEVHEKGMAVLMDGTEGNRKYLAHHRTLKPGTIVRVINHTTQKQVFVRVIGNLENTEAPDVVLRISKSAFDMLGGDGRFPVEVSYFK